MADDMLEILVVEDDQGMALLVEERLVEVEGWKVTVALSAAECRERIEQHAYDVVLLDRGLPDCDGATLIPEILNGRPDVAIVMLTGADSAMSATETLKLGAWDYVVKQPDLAYLDELPGVVRHCAERLAWRREEARLRGEVDLLLTAMRAEADAVIIFDCDSRVRFWNAAAEQLFGWPTEEIVGRPLPLIADEQVAEFDDLRERAGQGQPLVGVETALRRRDGELVDVGLTLTAVRNPDGAVRAFVGVVRDISERRQLERDRADFAAMLTHDIKNPVTVIKGYASFLSEADLPEELADCAAGIERAATTINTLVTNFLMSATIEAGTLKVAREPVKIADLVVNAVKGFHAAAALVHVDLLQEGDPTGLSVIGDRMHLERALGNLIGNAIKFSTGGGTVRVGAHRDSDNHVVLTVADTGPGISPEEVPHVFEKYRREKGTHGIDGAGLGLFIVRNLVEAHGGHVSVESEQGVGTTFMISLPMPEATAAG